MITKEKINRINQLSRKSKTSGLTEDEKAEQQLLRREYIDSFKANLKAQLDQIEIVEGIEKEEGRDKNDYVVEIEDELS
ncbi:DUF896 domain-containing protein [Aminicella lysinilytica]|uniref:UPF0291 protein EV211_1064 n=1 Tax=Aminicella lysinilytica TaxID=433323 RepID=A0A4R6Q8N4_9FIRM|nr:uncharacterized protein YnzC (UPF0291/DUF896 family) [Aminicella lysinilytica]